jgi:hypothetical protein
MVQEDTHSCIVQEDIFETKILTSPLSVAFPEYTGGDSAELALEFIQEQFLARVPKHQDRVRIFFISSTDENSFHSTFESIQEVL